MWSHFLIVIVSLIAIVLWLHWGRLSGYGIYAILPAIIFIARAVFYLLIILIDGRPIDPYDDVASFIDLYSATIWCAGALIMIRHRKHGI